MDRIVILSGSTLVLMLLCFIFAIFLFTVPTSNRLGNRLLGSYLVLMAISISAFWYGYYYDVNLVVDRIRDDVMVISNAILYLYILASLRENFKLRAIDLLHLLPLVAIILIKADFYFGTSAYQKLYVQDIRNQASFKISSVVTLITPIIYYSLSFVVLLKARVILRENYSDDKVKTYRWLFQLLTFNTLLFLFSILKNATKHLGSFDILNNARILLVWALISFILWIVLKALYYPDLFRGWDNTIPPVSTLLKQNEDIPESSSGMQDQITQYMTEQKPYLDSSLTLQKLASLLEMPSHELSILINHSLGKHFFDFVNEYRIREAQNLLLDAQNSKKTIQEILYEVGFNSKSSFNTAFKKYTQLTPTQFRKRGSSAQIISDI